MNFTNILKGQTDLWTEQDRFSIEAVETKCSTCRWLQPGGVTCESFPEGIPSIILMGVWDHTYRFEDEDLLYVPSLGTKVSTSKGNTEHVPAGSSHGGEFAKKKFSATDFAHSVSGDYSDKSKSDRLKEEYRLSKNVLSPEEHREYIGKLNSLADDIANNRDTHSLHTVNGEYTEKRKQEHREILKNIFKDAAKARPAKGEKPQFTILGGIGGSGKSKFGEDDAREYDPAKSIVLDSDKIKEMLPNYDPEKAHLFHKEAGRILDQALRHARKLGLNTVYDSTMGRPDSRLLQSFKKSGFTTKASYMHISPQESAGRAILRWKGSIGKEGKVVRGRIVPPHIILGMKDNIKNFDITKEHADSWSLWRNDRPKGSKPEKVSEGVKVKKAYSYSTLLTK